MGEVIGNEFTKYLVDRMSTSVPRKNSRSQTISPGNFTDGNALRNLPVFATGDQWNRESVPALHPCPNRSPVREVSSATDRSLRRVRTRRRFWSV